MTRRGRLSRHPVLSRGVASAVLLVTLGSTVWASQRQGVEGLEAWARVLDEYAHRGGIDYAALEQDRSDLDAFLKSLSEVELDNLGREARIAFWCNAYNAVVVHFVLERYPEISSVKATSGFFDELRFPVAGEARTLDEIESEARNLGDPRVHFAVVCASTSCPDLRTEPYRAEILDRQLEEDTRRFLGDIDKGLAFDPDGNILHLSSIFKWYAGDFTGGSTVVAYFVRARVLDWILPHLPAELAARLREREPKIRYMDYDWSLNDRPRRSAQVSRSARKVASARNDAKPKTSATVTTTAELPSVGSRPRRRNSSGVTEAIRAATN